MKDMKKSKTLSRISVKTCTAEGDVFKILLTEGLKLKRILVEPGLTVYSLGDGTIIELYGPGSCYPDYLFKNSNVVIGFKVDNLDEVLVLMQNSGAILLGKTEMICNALIYCHMLLSNETVIGLYQDLIPINEKVG
jgi:hypothetical protein